jgi:dienelactone hydrolase
MRRIVLALTALVALVCVPMAAAAFLDQEPKTYSKTNERFQYVTGTPEYQQLLRQKGLDSPAEELAIQVDDPERQPQASLCVHHMDGCAGDVRLYDWNKSAGNIRKGPILWTARSGATISGHVWMTSGGPAKKPGVMIINGSVQAPEELYWAQAAALARAGYVVLTWDPQTQGRSDGPGAAPTENENRAPQSVEAFTEGGVDALDFFLSTPGKPFRPRNSRTMPSVNHSDKQIRRVAEGRNAAYNPLFARLDPTRIGIAGNSLGAFAVSQVASQDKRVDAVVAWDQLSTEQTAAGGTGNSGVKLPPRVPGLGMSGDYGIGSPNGAAGVNPKPRESAPDPRGASAASREFSKAGVPTGQVNTLGGTHFESAVIPNPGFPATLRGNDQYAWYTIAWFDKYVRHSPDADRLLLTNRWQKDAAAAKVDPNKDPNTYSRDLLSRIDVRRSDRSHALCEDLRKGCGILVDDRAGPFSAIDFAYGRNSLKPRRPARCASRIRAPKKLDLSKSRRRLKVRLRLTQRTKTTLRAARHKQRTRRSTKALKTGSRSVTVRLKKRAKAGRYRVTVRMRCDSGKQAKVFRLRVKR